MGLAKKIGYTFVGLVTLSVLTNMINKDEPVQPKTEQSAPAVEKKEAKPRVTQEKFDQIVQGDTLNGTGGMSIAEVKTLLGEPDSSSQSSSGDLKLDMLSWSSWKDGLSVMITFTNGHVSSKTISKF